MKQTKLKALVTGASRGIGRAIALELGRQGMEVYGTAISDRGITSIGDMLQSEGYAGSPLKLDVSDAASIEQLFAELTNRNISPDVLVTTAGSIRDGLLMRLPEEDWRQIIETNLTSVFRMTRFCIRNMVKARWGRVISIASVSGLMGNAGQANYAAAKAGIIGFTKSVAREVASRNVTVNAIAPGFIDTDLTQAIPEAMRSDIVKQIPLGRFGKPEEIAPFVALLASEAGAYVTGETICISGGLYMR